MRRTFLLLVCALALFSVKQTCGQIVRGRVVDQERQPVVGVAVVMLDTDSTYLAAAASDADGRFAIASEVRPYRLLFQHLAYEMQTLTSEHDEAGEVVLHEYTNALDAVVVEGEKPIVRVEEGRLAYDLEAVSKGKAVNNAYEALTQLPGVSEQDGGLTLAGAGGVTVILNGKPSTMSAEQLASLLRSTPVERIEKAEVMYSTPPQYHVRGAAINLVLRRSHDYSFSGEVHANYTNRFYSNWDAGGNFAFSSPEWSAEVTYSAGQAKTKRIIDLYSRHTLADGEHEIAQRQNITSKGTWHRLRAAAEYAPQGKGRLSIAYTGAYTPHTSGLVRADGNLVNSVSSPGGDNTMHNAALRYTSASGLDLSADYTHYSSWQLAAMRNRYADGSRTAFDVVSGQSVDRVNVSADQSHDLGNGWGMTYGGIFSWAGDHDYQRYTLCEGDIATVDTDSHLDEYTGNLYAGVSKEFAKGSFSLSLAGEYYRAGDYDNWSLYPQATLLLTPAEKHLVQISLSSDKTYPSYWEMQQSTSYIDGYSEIRGTPGLRPSKSYNGQAMYMYKQKYIFMLFWNEMPDYFNQTAWQAPDRLALVYQTLNWNTNRQWGANVIVPLRLGKWLDSRLTLTGMRMTQRCDAFHDLAFDRSKWLGGGAHGQHDPSEPQARPDARPLGLLSERGHPGDIRHRPFVERQRRCQVDVRQEPGEPLGALQRHFRKFAPVRQSPLQGTVPRHGFRHVHPFGDGAFLLPFRHIQGEAAQDGRHVEVRALTGSRRARKKAVAKTALYSERESNPHDHCWSQDFKSGVSTYSTIRATAFRRKASAKVRKFYDSPKSI